MSKYPESEKFHKVAEQSQICGEFLDWLQFEKRVHLPNSIEKLLAEFFEIDLKKLEAEKREILVEVRLLSSKPAGHI